MYNCTILKRALIILFILSTLKIPGLLVHEGSFFTKEVYAQQDEESTSLRGKIEEITLGENLSKIVRVKLADGTYVESVITPQAPNYSIDYKKGDKVVVQKLQIGEDAATYIITDFYRVNYLIFLFVVFGLLAVVVGKKHGIYSLLSMFLSFLIIFKFVLPQILSGSSPVIITVLASFGIVPITFYLSHGINKKTHVAVISTFISLILTSVLAAISVHIANLTGFSSDEAMFLKLGDSAIDMKGILLAGIIIGFLGVMDDVTVSQAGIVMKLGKAKRKLGILELYTSAMDIGRDHIASMINTLVLVYAGAALPLLLMFIKSSLDVVGVLNTEIIADEIVRTLVGSIGLIVAVPIATFLAAVVAVRVQKKVPA